MKLLKTVNCAIKRLSSCRYSSSSNRIHVCIIGSGPAGYYTAQQILKNPDVKVDVYERLPVPFGLVRFGVAPDHPDVKNVINTFTATASHPNCSFVGNVNVGKDISVQELREAYNCLVFAYGAEEDRRLDIPGEELENVLSARNFVGWYNGLPADAGLKVDLDVETATIVGQGNVAVDVARILLTPIHLLKETDITEHALSQLSRSHVKRVVLVGRRGPLQTAFTIKELREMTKLEGTRPIIHKQDMQGLHDQLSSVSRPRKRLTELMITTAEADHPPAAKEWELMFLRSPNKVHSNSSGKVQALELTINRLEGKGENPEAVATSQTQKIDCGMVLRSIGYKSRPIDASLPFNHEKGIIQNTAGRLPDSKGLYCSGWVKTGPVGVIVSTMNSSFDTGKNVLSDIQNGEIPQQARAGKEHILTTLKERGCQTVSFEDWNKIHLYEEKVGSKSGKPREKLLSIPKMLEIAAQK